MKLQTLFASILNIDESTLNDDSGPDNLGTWTSKIHFELVTAMEEIYGIRLTRREIRAMTTLGAARRLVESKLMVGG
ncbi:MAG: acyl carrier protein [Candidatus Competibacteraceae bacterium]